ncbi:AbrB/MazE/SpoVT family DNA-binding domain-containing protein [Candidatus Woesearchaeota archaeon]|nr:AbrB/MazE/SpoVT family DNA-binding domain-containing protein [Candidatus Woesearchaeota archaeon]
MVFAKKWGNSIGIILPKDTVKSQGIKEGDDMVVSVFKRGNLEDVFGKLKTEMTGQEFKNLARKGWKSSSDEA